MTRILIAAAIAALFSSVAAAQPTDIFPILDGGIVSVGVETGASTQDIADTASVGIVQLNTPGGGEAVLNCAPEAGPGLTLLFSAVTVQNPGDGTAAQIKARAYSGAGCVGDLFADSENSGFVRFLGPASPIIVEASTDADITIP